MERAEIIALLEKQKQIQRGKVIKDTEMEVIRVLNVIQDAIGKDAGENENESESESESGAPPIGLRPKFIADSARLSEVHDAIKRYEAAGVEVPAEWWVELSSLMASDPGYVEVGTYVSRDGVAVNLSIMSTFSLRGRRIHFVHSGEPFTWYFDDAKAAERCFNALLRRVAAAAM